MIIKFEEDNALIKSQPQEGNLHSFGGPVKRWRQVTSAIFTCCIARHCSFRITLHATTTTSNAVIGKV